MTLNKRRTRVFEKFVVIVVCSASGLKGLEEFMDEAHDFYRASKVTVGEPKE